MRRLCLTIDQIWRFCWWQDGDAKRMKAFSRIRFFCYFAIFFLGGEVCLCVAYWRAELARNGCRPGTHLPSRPSIIWTPSQDFQARRRQENYTTAWKDSSRCCWWYFCLYLYSPMVFFVSASLLGLSRHQSLSRYRCLSAISAGLVYVQQKSRQVQLGVANQFDCSSVFILSFSTAQ